MVIDPVTLSAIIAAASAAVKGGVSYMGAKKERKEQEKLRRPYEQAQQRKENLISELLSSIEGEGKYSRFFQDDPETFQKSVVDPLKGTFQREIAPQIQQASIASGQQRSSSMEDQLTRAGVSLDEMINKAYMDFQGRGQQRAASTLSGIIGGAAPEPLKPMTQPGQELLGSASGFLESDAFADWLGSFGKQADTKTTEDKTEETRPGYVK